MRGYIRRAPALALLMGWVLCACGSHQHESSAPMGGATTGGAGTNGAQASGAVGGQLAGGGAAPASAGDATSSAGADVTEPADDAPLHTVVYQPNDGIILNPERGFFATTSLVDAQDLSSLRTSGVTLVHSYVRLDDYRTADIPGSVLTQVSAGLARARQAGVKVILRFAYNFGPYPDSEPDAPKEW